MPITRRQTTTTDKITDEKAPSLSTISTKPPIKSSSISILQKLIILVTLFATISSVLFLSRATHHSSNEAASVYFVLAYGWITAVSTGLGVVPFLFTTQELSQRWLGCANSIAAGMMLTASGTLAFEGFHAEDASQDNMHWGISCSNRMGMGFLLGVVFIIFIKWLLDGDDVGVGELQGADAKRALLVVAVMTLHSFAEGVGIGVAFSGAGGRELGTFISLSLAIHNVPEGLAVAVVLIPRGVSKISTAGWSIFSSIPQPLVAIPVFMFVSAAIPWLPIGLGFASGAMLYVALFELLPEANELLGVGRCLCLTLTSAFVMTTLQRVAASASL